MKKLALICLCLFGTVDLYAQQANNMFIPDFIQKWENAKTYTLKVAEAMPDSTYTFKPVPEEMSFAEQLVHISSNMAWIGSTYLKGEKNPFEKLSADGMSKQEIIELLNKTFDYVDGVVAAFDPTDLNDTVDFFAGPMSKRRMFLLLADHVTHHTGQLVVYLRLNGIKPPEYVGW